MIILPSTTKIVMSEYVNIFPSSNQLPGEEILIIADSRGRKLDLFMSSILKVDTGIVICSGAGLIDSILCAKRHITDLRWSQIYCLARICSLTIKDKITRKVSQRYYSPLAAANCYGLILAEARQIISNLLSHTSYDPKVIFTPITGMYLDIYNKSFPSPSGGTNHAQLQLNQTVAAVNRVIVRFNESHHVITPWLARIFHRRHRKSYTNKYHRLAYDGCHLSDEIYSSWARALQKAVMINTKVQTSALAYCPQDQLRGPR